MSMTGQISIWAPIAVLMSPEGDQQMVVERHEPDPFCR
jgi:hypothetical protein